MLSIRSVLFASLLTVAAGCTSTSNPNAVPPYACAVPGEDAIFADEVLELVNRARIAEGLEPVVLDSVLCDVAAVYACEMVEENFFAHENPQTNISPGERLTVAGYIYYAMGENLAVGQSSPDEVVDDWLDSPRHRANILSPDWRETGIAVRRGGAHEWCWVQEFADPVDLGDQ